MSETLAFLRQKSEGGSESVITETTLWTNSAPTSDFNAQTVTISDDINNYSYIGIEYEFSTAITTLINKVFFPVDLFKTYRFNDNTQHAFGTLGMQHSTSNYMYSRIAYYVSDTSIGFSTGYGINRVYNNAGSSVPLKIIGIKLQGESGTPAWELGDPDVTDAFTVNPTETHSITVTREPRYIQLYRTVSNSTLDYGYSCIYDVKNDKFRYIGATTQFATGTSKNPFLGDVTSSVVQVKGATSGSTVYKFAVAIWY